MRVTTKARRRADALALLAGFIAVGAHASARAGDGPTLRTPSQPWIWWEAETPRASNFPAQNPFTPSDNRGAQALSGGRWIGTAAPGKKLFLEYAVSVAQGGAYDLYVRKFWRHGPFKWRFDGQPFRPCAPDSTLLDAVDVGGGASASWVHLGSVSLKTGSHVLRIELTDPGAPAAFDCFILTAVPFVARGLLKPGESYPPAPQGWFTFDPPRDPFAASPVDLRRLNEARAGDGGFIQARGDAFIHAKTGKPIRFWAVDAGHDVLGPDRSQVDRWARFLAKLGVNMVRLHGPVWRDDDPAKVDEVKLDRIHYLLAALAKQGIYLELSTYFPLWLQHLDGRPGFEGMDHDRHPFGLSFFNESLQELQRDWWRVVLTSKNPYTGRALGADPALAFIEVVNEDSLLFWTFAPYQSVPAPQMEILERRFAAWLRARDGTLARTFARWGGRPDARPIQGDDPTHDRVGLLPLQELVSRRDARTADTLEFLTAVQRSYYDGMYRFLKADLGFAGSVTGSNWITADPQMLGPLDKWSNSGCDFMDRHGYFGGLHEGERAAYLLSSGDRFTDATALKFETGKVGEVSPSLPLMDLAYNGKPSTISEINWVPPNRYRSELPALAAAYGALQGTDAFFFFAATEVGWGQRLEKFSVNDPAIMGQFPAAALLYRQGLVKTAGPVVRLELDLPDLYTRSGPGVATPQNLDALRARDVLPTPFSAPTSTSAFDPLAFLVGRVEVNVTTRGGRSRLDDLSHLVDRGAKIVRSATGELAWDWGRGLVKIDASTAQGAVGLLAAAGPIELGDVVISSRNEYGAVLLVPLDGEPLRSSRKMLLQVMSEDSNSGWSAPGQGPRPIVAVGGPPLIVRTVVGHVRFKPTGAPPVRVTALDLNGYPVGAALRVGNNDLELLPTTLAYLIER